MSTSDCNTALAALKKVEKELLAEAYEAVSKE